MVINMSDWVTSIFEQFSSHTESKPKEENPKKIDIPDIKYERKYNTIGTDDILDTDNFHSIAEGAESEPIVIEINTKPVYNTIECNNKLRDEVTKFLDKCTDADLDYLSEKINTIKHYRELEKKYAPQLPSVIEIIGGYLHDGKFYKDSFYTVEISPEVNKIYVDLFTNKTYRYSSKSSRYIEID